MDKQILYQYIDACELVKETEREIQKLKNQKGKIERDIVKGSSHDFPYTLQTYHLEGIGYQAVNQSDELGGLEEVLQERLQKAEEIKMQVEKWMNTIPQRMQRIIKYKIFEEMTWREVAVMMGRKATPDRIRKEFESFMKAA